MILLKFPLLDGCEDLMDVVLFGQPEGLQG